MLVLHVNRARVHIVMIKIVIIITLPTMTCVCNCNLMTIIGCVACFLMHIQFDNGLLLIRVSFHMLN